MAIKFVIRRRGDSPDSPPLDEKIFTGPIVSIGSDTAAALYLNDSSVAAEQAIIIDEAGHLLLMNRAAGTTLNDETLAREALRPLVAGDCLYIGDYAIKLEADAAPTNSSQALSQESVRDGGAVLSSPSLHKDNGFEPAVGASLSVGESSALFANQPAKAEEMPPKNFAAILDSLRTEEDSFYFLIESGFQTGKRVPIESAEMLLGWDETGQKLAFDHASVFAPRAVVRKDWSGVVVEPQTSGLVSINDQTVESAQRLRNGDRLTVVPTGVTAEENIPVLIFYEPASLVVLDSLLPQTQLPPPVLALPNSTANDENALVPAVTPTIAAATPRTAKPVKARWRTERNHFGYFTFLEVALMAVGTFSAAALIFVLLQFSLSR